MKNLQLFLVAFLMAITTTSQAQLFGKANPGYVVLTDGTRLDGYTKVKTFNQEDGIQSLFFLKEPEGEKTTYKIKNIQEFQVNSVTYVRMKIKVSLIRKSELICPAVYISPLFQLVFNPKDYDDKNIFKTFDNRSSRTDTQLDIFPDRYATTELHLTKKDEYFNITRLSYAKNMKEICGDNSAWMKKVEADPNWLKFANIVENLKFYEETLK